jgi:hypothetical protein
VPLDPLTVALEDLDRSLTKTRMSLESALAALKEGNAESARNWLAELESEAREVTTREALEAIQVIASAERDAT